LYQDWNIVRYDVYAKYDRHPGLPTHCHPCEKLVARKPGGLNAVPYVIEPIPVESKSIPEDIFSKIDVGMSESELRSLCGNPDIVNTLVAEGIQFSAFSGVVDHGYVFHQWYYGLIMIEVSDGMVRAKNRYKSVPVRMRVLRPRT
jgi:tellurite methyltransferase